MAGLYGVRAATEADLADVCRIVNHYILNTTINFRIQEQTPPDWLIEFEQHHKTYPWLVATRQASVVGVAYASPWKSRAAYQWSTEVTVYVDANEQRKRVGSSLYARLLPFLDERGYHTQVAVVALPNSGSVALHERFGFEHAGTLREIGHKFGGWRDVGFWQRCRPS